MCSSTGHSFLWLHDGAQHRQPDSPTRSGSGDHTVVPAAQAPGMTSVYDSATSRSKATAQEQLSTVYSESLDNLLPSAEALKNGKQM